MDFGLIADQPNMQNELSGPPGQIWWTLAQTLFPLNSQPLLPLVNSAIVNSHCSDFGFLCYPQKCFLSSKLSNVGCCCHLGFSTTVFALAALQQGSWSVRSGGLATNPSTCYEICWIFLAINPSTGFQICSIFLATISSTDFEMSLIFFYGWREGCSLVSSEEKIHVDISCWQLML